MEEEKTRNINSTCVFAAKDLYNLASQKRSPQGLSKSNQLRGISSVHTSFHQRLIKHQIDSFFLYSVENLLPPPDSAFQLGDLFPMVKVINPEVSAVFISKKGGFRGHFESRYHQVMKNFLWLGCRFPLCVHKTKSLGLRGEDKSR